MEWTNQRVVRLIAALFVITVLSGCIDGKTRDEGDPPVPTVEVGEDWAAVAFGAEGDHDHNDPTHHTNRTTPNFEVVGHDPLITDYHGTTSGSYWCGDVSETSPDGRRIAVVHSYSSDVALVTIDVTDPASPTMIGELVMPRTFVYDVAVSPDGRWASIAANDPEAQRDDGSPTRSADIHLLKHLDAQGLGLVPDAGTADLTPYWRDACTGEETPVPFAPGFGLDGTTAAGPLEEGAWGPGVILVDLADPAEPAFADWFPTPILGSHSTSIAQVDDTTFVMGAVTNLEHHSSYFEVLSVAETALGAKLVHESTLRPAPPTEGEQPYINGHVDGEIAKHPITGDTLAFLADWDGGLVIYDMNDPKTPKELGRWTNYKGHDATKGIVGDDSGSIHTAFPMGIEWDGRHYTVIGQEVLDRPTETPTGIIYIVDTTDPTDPQPAMGWTIPVDPVWDENILWSTHYADIQVRDDGRKILFVALYHGGLWAVNVTDLDAPDTLGVFIPAEESPKPPTVDARFDWAPLVMEALILDSEHVLTYDGVTGAYTLRFDPDVPMPDVEEWPVSLE